jgi:hypothetical protein
VGHDPQRQADPRPQPEATPPSAGAASWAANQNALQNVGHRTPRPPPPNIKLTCPAAIRFCDNDKQASSENQITWPGQVQRPDTSHGLDGEGPNLSPR